MEVECAERQPFLGKGLVLLVQKTVHFKHLLGNINPFSVVFQPRLTP